MSNMTVESAHLVPMAPAVSSKEASKEPKAQPKPPKAKDRKSDPGKAKDAGKSAKAKEAEKPAKAKGPKPFSVSTDTVVKLSEKQMEVFMVLERALSARRACGTAYPLKKSFEVVLDSTDVIDKVLNGKVRSMLKDAWYDDGKEVYIADEDIRRAFVKVYMK